MHAQGPELVQEGLAGPAFLSRVLSVISSSRQEGKPHPQGAGDEIDQVGWASWTGETFTASLIGRGLMACQIAACRQAVARAHSPMAWMSWFSSARGTNLDGGTVPSTGCCQRSRASTPKMVPSAWHCGW